jgi:hypothetical protein
MASAKALRKIVRFIRFIRLTCSLSSSSTAGSVTCGELPEKQQAYYSQLAFHAYNDSLIVNFPVLRMIISGMAGRVFLVSETAYGA